MLRFLMVGAVLCAAAFMAVSAIGRAMDQGLQDRIVFTRGGVTFDCERRFVKAGKIIRYEDGSSRRARRGGEVVYTDCHIVRS